MKDAYDEVARSTAKASLLNLGRAYGGKQPGPLFSGELMQQRPRKAVDPSEEGGLGLGRKNSVPGSLSPPRASMDALSPASRRKRIIDDVRRDFGSQIEQGYKQIRDAVYGDPAHH